MKKPDLVRVLSARHLFAIGYGDLGSSIYYALGVTALFALGATPIALLLAGLTFICTALTYAELSSMYRDSGGASTFASKAFGDVMGFIAGWGLLLDYVITIAISAFAVAPYLSYFIAELKHPAVHISFTIFLIALLGVVNFLGVKESTRMSLILVGLTIVSQVVIVGIGFGYLFDPIEFFNHLKINGPDLQWSPTWPQFIKGTAMAMVAYTGIESISQLGSEVKNPKKNISRAILFTMAVLLLSYIGISFVALSALNPKELSSTWINDPIAGIVSKLPIGGAVLGPWIGLLAGGILFIAANAGLVGSSRLAFGMGENYKLPRFFYTLHKKRQTPYIALLFFGTVASLVVLASRGSMEFLADLYNFGSMVAFTAAHLSLIRLRMKAPDLERPFRIKGCIKIKGRAVPLSAILGVMVTISVWCIVIYSKPGARYFGLIWMGVGLWMFFAYRKKHRLETKGELILQKIEMPEYQNMMIKHVLVPTTGATSTETVQAACEMAKLHGATLTALYVLPIASTLPVDHIIEDQLKHEDALGRAEAIAREFGIPFDKRVVASRTISAGIAQVIQEGKGRDPYDLVVMGSYKPIRHQHKISQVVENVMKLTSCRLMVIFPSNKTAE